MRLISRYLLRECLVALGFCFSAFLILWIAIDLVNELHGMQEDKMRGADVLAYYFFKIPEFLPIALPVALLLALLYALTNHARHNEITAMRAAGVSLGRISLPYFGVATAAAFGLFALNELVAPAASEQADGIRSRRTQSTRPGGSRNFKQNCSFTNSRDGRSWHVAVYSLRTGEMRKPAIDWQLPDGSVRNIFAQRGIYTNGTWTFFEVREVRRAAGPDAVSVKSETNMLSFPDFSETPELIRSEISINETLANERRTRRADIPIETILNYLRLHPNPERSIEAKIYTKLHGRFAGPATCFMVVLLAVPFASASGRRNVFVGVASSIVIFFVYYIVQQFGLALAEAGRIPPWIGAWLPNLLVGGVGLWMLKNVR